MGSKSLSLFASCILLGGSPIGFTKTVEPIVEQGISFYIPQFAAKNTFTGGPVFLRPSGSNDYAVLVSPFNAAVATPILSPTWQPEGVDTDFDAGFALGFNHTFFNTGNDWSLNWTHLHSSDNATFPVNRNPPPAQQMAGPFWNIGPDAGTTSAARGKVNYNYDVVNAEVGQYLNVGTKLNARLFAGISGLHLKQMMAANFSGTDPILGFYTFNIDTQSEYNAGGLRLGVEGHYQGLYGINVVGLLAGNLYIGSQQPNTSTSGTGTVLTNAGIPVNYQSINHDDYIEVLPSVDAKLGISYSHAYSADASLTLEAGYRATLYIDAIQNYVPSTYVPGSLGIVTGSVFLQSLIKTTDNFALDGPYISASLVL